jgi:hypothetical protein
MNEQISEGKFSDLLISKREMSPSEKSIAWLLLVNFEISYQFIVESIVT